MIINMDDEDDFCLSHLPVCLFLTVPVGHGDRGNGVGVGMGGVGMGGVGVDLHCLESGS